MILYDVNILIINFNINPYVATTCMFGRTTLFLPSSILVSVHIYAVVFNAS